MKLSSSLLALSFFTLLAGCSGESASTEEDGDMIPDETGATEDALSRRFHYTPSVQEVDWLPGCGVRPPDGTACKMGFTLTYTRSFIDLQTTIRTSVNNTRHTITVKIDTWSNSQVHPRVAVRPETIDLDIDGFMMGQSYTVFAKDHQNRTLWSGKITPMPAP